MKRIIQHLCRLVSSGKADELTDPELLDCFAAQQDEAAFAVLMRRHGPMVLAVCRRVLGNANDAEDAFQATFLILIRKAGSLSRPERLGNWLYGVAYRTALDARAHRSRRQARERQVAEMPASETAPDTVWQDVRPILDDELNRLPEKYRAPLVYCYLEGKTKEETARHLGWPEGTVSGRLARAKDLVRERLSRRGVTLTPAAFGVLLAANAAPAAVPAPLLDTTLRVGLLFAAGQAASAGALAEPVAALTERVLRTMSLLKLKTAATVLLVLGLLATGAGVLAYQTWGETPAVGPAMPERDAAWVENRIQAWQPTAAERRLDDIGWAKDLRDAQRLAQEHGRPVFLFAHQGSMVNARCDGAASTLRAGALSNERVIDLLNSRFVSVHVSLDAYQQGAAPLEERTALQHILDEAQKAKLGVRFTQVYVLAPDGSPIDALRVRDADKQGNLALFLERTAEKLQAAAGKPVVAPSPQFRPPTAPADALVLHLTARYLKDNGTEPFAPQDKGLGEAGDSWRALPSEEWLVFDRAEQARLVPAQAAVPGLLWHLDRDLAARLLTHFFPQTPNSNPAGNVLLQQDLRGQVLQVERDVAQAWIEGSLLMRHPFARNEDDDLVRADIIGFMEFESAGKRIRSLRLVTDRATYGSARKDKGYGGYSPPVPFGVAVFNGWPGRADP